MKKDWTGERLETHIINENTIEHLHRYAIAKSICLNKKVLDLASGEGYGSNLIAQVAKDVIGVDISNETIELAKNKYKRLNLKFICGSATEIPLENESVDVVTSFETLEHHDQHEEMFLEVARVLKKDGVLIISSPDKKYYSDIPNYNNPHHIKELYREDFKDLVSRHFKNSSFYLQKMVSGSLIIPEMTFSNLKVFNGEYEKIEDEKGFNGLYNICVASNSSLPDVTASLFDGSILNNSFNDDVVLRIRNSWSYKIGNFLLTPLSILKNGLKF